MTGLLDMAATNCNKNNLLHCAPPHTHTARGVRAIGKGGPWNSWHKAHNIHYRIQKTEYRTQSTEHRIQNTEYRIQNKEYRIQNTETHVHKTTYGPLTDLALHVMLLMWANPLLGQVEGVGSWKWGPFWAINGTHLAARCNFTGPKKVTISRAHPSHLSS